MDNGANVNSTNDEGETALDIMVQRGRHTCVMGLLTRGADASLLSKSGSNAIHYAIKVCVSIVLFLIINKGYKILG